MFQLAQIRRQWPAATATLAGLAFILNHYRIAGLENVRLERRSPAEIAHMEARGDNWSTALLSDLNRLQLPSELGFPSNGQARQQPQAQFPTSAERPFPSTSPNTFSGAPVGSQFGSQSGSVAGSQVGPAAGSDVVMQALNGIGAMAGGSSSASPMPINSVPMNSLPTNALAPSTLAPNLLAEPDLGRMLSASEKFAIWESKNLGAGVLSGAASSIAQSASSIRVASFHVQALGAAKLAKPHVFEMLVRILRRFDVVALQGIQSTRDDILPIIVERLNQSGRNYDYIIGPRVGRSAPLEQFAYIFDTQRLETDRYQLYTVDDPEDLIAREPLVAWFRTKGHAAHHAFTFSMINVRIDPAFAERERQLLPGLVNAVQNDGRGEDDWILLGDFAGGDAELFPLTKQGVRLALIGIPTNVEGTSMLDEIAFSGPATVEFNGKVGVYDFLRQYNLSLEQALEVSDHLPIWAEFSTLEGAEPGRIAPVGGDVH